MSQVLANYYNNKCVKTILGEKTEFIGKMSFNDSLKINGSFKGTIKASGLLWIGEGASVSANISAKSVVVSGTVNGDICASEKIDMLVSGRVYGNIKAKKIKISDGVIFNGECEIIK